MDLRNENVVSRCSTTAVASYVDGELDEALETELEKHFAVCRRCAEELNLQKQFLCTLNSSLMNDEEIELPANFTKKIVTNAESTVRGLRKPSERFNALVVFLALLLIGLFALGSDAFGLLGGAGDVFEKLLAVIGFVGHVIYSFILGIGVILRSLSVHIQAPIAGLFLIGMLSAAFLLFSRAKLRIRRA